jgi:hypothetical protein
MILIDTPGNNDPDQDKRDDTKLTSNIIRYLRDQELLNQSNFSPKNKALSGIM